MHSFHVRPGFHQFLVAFAAVDDRHPVGMLVHQRAGEDGDGHVVQVVHGAVGGDGEEQA